MSTNTTSMAVLSVIAGKPCGICEQVKIGVPVSEIFEFTAASLWVTQVSIAYPTVPDEVLTVHPNETLASIADRIAEYLNSH